MSDPLSQFEFNLWREGDTAFKRQMLDHIASQQTLNAILDRRMTTAEVNLATMDANRNSDRASMAKWATVIAAAISAAVGGLFSLLGR